LVDNIDILTEDDFILDTNFCLFKDIYFTRISERKQNKNKKGKTKTKNKKIKFKKGSFMEKILYI
jgi:hypothetical protein